MDDSTIGASFYWVGTLLAAAGAHVLIGVGGGLLVFGIGVAGFSIVKTSFTVWVQRR